MRSVSLPLLLAFGAAACSSNSPPGLPSFDSGVHGGADGGPGADATPGSDGGIAAGADAGPGADASPGADAAPASDASPASDTGPASTDGAILPPIDAGDPFTDDAGLPEPPWVSIDVRTSSACTPLIPCGGDITGTWDVVGSCVEVPGVQTVLTTCPLAHATLGTHQARGRVTFNNGLAHRTAQSEVEIDLHIPALCANAVGGCTAIQASFRVTAPDSACIADASGNCDCASRTVSMIQDSDGYTLVGDEIVSQTFQKHWAYCVANSTLTYEDTSPTLPHEPGINVLGKR
jgi:hypothetical protein